MVASVSRVIGEGGPVRDEHCTPYDQALEQGAGKPVELRIIPNIREIRTLEALGASLSYVNMRVGEQTVKVHTTGCLPEHESIDFETKVKRVKCPEELAQRCGNCVLSIMEQVDEFLKPNNMPTIQDYS
jgi:hypothetical protein